MSPLALFEAVWSRCDQLSALHAYLALNTSAILQPDELLRAEWVARVSALDLYIHELVAQFMLATFEGNRKATPAYLKFQVTSEILNRIRAATSASDAGAAFDLHVRSNLSRVTYQYPEDIADGVRLCSTVALWNEIAMQRGATPATRESRAKSHKTDLSLLVRRRNIIAHEGDLQQALTREPFPISAADLAFVRKEIEAVVRAIDKVIV